MNCRPAAWSCAWLLLAGAVVAAPADDTAERARIAADRQAVEARYEAARRDCETRFVVNDCLDQARQDRRAALEPLQRQIHLLDDARRRERAVERLRVIQARQSAAAERPALATAAAPASAASAAPPLPVRRAVRPPPPAAASASAAALAAQQRQARQQQRLQQARAHQAAVQARNAERDAQRKPAAGLPVPGAAASAP
jgi:hypothetical protein